MVGANYMGGKRHTARAKSKDVIGRAQRRHFGKQRLASALRVTQDNRAHRNAQTLSAILPQITLAHARNEKDTGSNATSLRGVVSGDRSYVPKPPSNVARYKKPSKVLGTLDTLDHVSMRAAIDRILQKSNLVGINTSTRKETVHTERMQTPVDPDTRTEAQVSTHAFDSGVSYPEISEHQYAGLYGIDPNPRYGPTESDTSSAPGSPYRNPEVTSWDTRRDNSKISDAFDPLPWSRSSPLPSSSQWSDNLILNLDTSPCGATRLGRPDAHSSREDCAYMDASESSSNFLPAFCRSSWSFSSEEGSAAVCETQRTTSLLIDSPGEETEAERVRDFPSIEDGDYRHTFPGGYGCDGLRFSTSPEVAECNVSSCISVDFLSDPHPWETIGKILKLASTEPSIVRSVKFDFTRDREGVGYVSEGSRAYDGLHSHVSSFETGIDAKPTNDIHAMSSADRSILEIADLEVPHTDDRMAIDTTLSPHISNSTVPLLNGAFPSTAPREVDETRVHARQDSEALPTLAIHVDSHTQSLSPITITVETTSVVPVPDLTFAGPCLFGDSDLEEDG
ncbi:hypothetical protein JVU11DRAFT_1482 [Chiua virens]|nr:hypothetical protein JVU11DRAFT_1482 [Chiua virens]